MNQSGKTSQLIKSAGKKSQYITDMNSLRNHRDQVIINEHSKFVEGVRSHGLASFHCSTLIFTRIPIYGNAILHSFSTLNHWTESKHANSSVRGETRMKIENVMKLECQEI